jgi:hypothetical protein
MGLFGAIANIASATVKTALSPIAVVKDAVDVATGGEATATKDLINSVGEDLSDAVDEVVDPY